MLLSRMYKGSFRHHERNLIQESARFLLMGNHFGVMRVIVKQANESAYPISLGAKLFGRVNRFRPHGTAVNSDNLLTERHVIFDTLNNLSL